MIAIDGTALLSILLICGLVIGEWIGMAIGIDVNVGGYKLSVLEIEASSLDHPAIVPCAVVGLPDNT